ncbi:hypothetical protein D4764_17G0000350 [Takifugu flavidus]|uniref:Uncharacterized protein n=1 Tax=Takifugu flavidus TaxID=433684 RepID=A0A5C6NTE9_9TELE|nr:hypothetical protein D4764_17G0000350 [Takifugu flavidus]
MRGSKGDRCLTWTVAGLPEATVRAAGASTPRERATDCVEKENNQHTPRAGEPGLWYHVGGLYGDDVWENMSMSLQYQLPDPGGELLGPVTTKRSRPGQPPPLRVRSKPPSPVSARAPFNVLRAVKKPTEDRSFQSEHRTRGHGDGFEEVFSPSIEVFSPSIEEVFSPSIEEMFSPAIEEVFSPAIEEVLSCHRGGVLSCHLVLPPHV